jgi:hypothetical protein
MAVDLPAGWMRQIIGASPRNASRTPKVCVGHFYDPATHQTVTVKLGAVWCRPVPMFRPATLDDEPANLLWWAAEYSEGAGQNTGDHEAPAIERGFSSILPVNHSTKKESGYVVIPGLSLIHEISTC